MITQEMWKKMNSQASGPRPTSAPSAPQPKEKTQSAADNLDPYLTALRKLSGQPTSDAALRQEILDNAARYSWLREKARTDTGAPFIACSQWGAFSAWTGESADERIDAAMRAEFSAGGSQS